MEATYGVEVANKYSLFIDEDADPLEMLRQNEELLKKKKDEVKPKSDKSSKTAKNKQVKKAVAPEPEQKAKQQDLNAPRREDNRSKGQNQSRSDRPERGGRPFREPRDNDDRRPDRRRRDENSGSDFRDSGGFGSRPEGGSSSGGGGFGRPEGGFGRPEGGFGRPDSGSGNRSELSRGGRGGFGRRGRGTRGARGGGPGGFDRGGRREYERHSGSDKTGIKAVEKRDGGGAHNWGSVKEELDDQLKDANDSQEINTTNEDTENQDPNESGELQESAVEAEPQEEEKQMTLDEWRALQSQNRVKTEFNIRKPNEGVDDTQWKKMTKLAKKPKEEEEESEEDSEEDDEDERARQKALLNIRITFNDSPRRGRGGRRPRGARGGRVMGGGGGGRGERRGPREAAPKFDDENDFPSLGVIKTVA